MAARRQMVKRETSCLRSPTASRRWVVAVLNSLRDEAVREAPSASRTIASRICSAPCDCARMPSVTCPKRPEMPCTALMISPSFNVVSEPVAQIGNPKLRTLAVSSAQRIAQMPQVPTFAEQGLGDLTSSEWMGLLAPKGTPAELVQRLHAAANRSMAQPKLQQALAEMAFSVTASSQAETLSAALIAALIGAGSTAGSRPSPPFELAP